MFKLGLYREIKNINVILKGLMRLLKKDISLMRSQNQDTNISKEYSDCSRGNTGIRLQHCDL